MAVLGHHRAATCNFSGNDSIGHVKDEALFIIVSKLLENSLKITTMLLICVKVAGKNL